MKLFDEPFNKMKAGKKSIEVRCYDENRRSVNIGDEIVFHKLPYDDERLCVVIKALYLCKSFRELYSMFPSEEFGNENVSVDELVYGISEIYSEEREKKYGVLGIRIKVI